MTDFNAADCSPDFRPLLERLPQDVVQSRQVIAYGLDTQFRLAFLNPAWFEAIRVWEAPDLLRCGVGHNILESMDEEAAALFREGYGRCLLEQRAWSHGYECSTGQRRRIFRMLAYPLPQGAGLFVVHAPVVEADVTALGEMRRFYEDAFRMLHQCSFCRRVQRQSEGKGWDWIRAWAAAPPRDTTHGYCEACFSFYSMLLDECLDALPLWQSDG